MGGWNELDVVDGEESWEWLWEDRRGESTLEEGVAGERRAL
jgi:hypothetical protein